MAQDLTIEIGIDTLSAIATLKNLGDTADGIFSKKRKLAFDDSAIKEFSNNLQNEFAKTAKSLDFSLTFASAQKSVATLKSSLGGVSNELVAGFTNVNVQMVKAQLNANALTQELIGAQHATEGINDAAKKISIADKVKGEVKRIAQEMNFSNAINLNPFEKFADAKEQLSSAIPTGALDALKGAFNGIVEAGVAARKITNDMESAFKGAGVSGKDLSAQIDETNKFTRELGLSLAVPPERLKQLAIQSATLGNATGKANEDLTKFAIGIEKATNGAVSGEQAIKILTGGFADPANAEAIETLSQKFPTLITSLSGTGDVATKAAAGVALLAPALLEASGEAQKIEGVYGNLTNSLTEGLRAFSEGIFDGLDTVASYAAAVGKDFNLEPVIGYLTSFGTILGQLLSVAFAPFVFAFDAFRQGAELLGPVFTGLVVILTGYITFIVAKTVAVYAATAAQVAWNIAMSANPVGAVVLALTGLVAVIGLAADALSESTQEQLENAEAQKKSIETQIESNNEQKKGVETTQALVKEFQELAGKSQLTADEQQRLHSIQNDLDKQYPDLIDQTKSFSENLKGVSEIGTRSSEAMTKLTQKGDELSKQLNASIKTIASAKRNVAIDELRDVLSSFNLFAGHDANEFRSKFVKVREEFERGLFSAKTLNDVDVAATKIREFLNSNIKVLKSEEQVALYEAVNKSISATREAVSSYNGETKKSAESSAAAANNAVSEYERLSDTLNDIRKKWSGLTDEQKKKEKDSFRSSIDQAKQSAKINEEQAKQLYGTLNNLGAKQSKSKADRDKEELKKLKEKYERQKEINEKALKAYEYERDKRLESNGGVENEARKEEYAKERLKAEEANLETYKKIYDIKLGDNNLPTSIGVKLSDDAKSKVINEVKELVNKISDTKIVLSKIIIDKENIEGLLGAMINSFDTTTLEINFESGNVAETEKALSQARKQVDDLNGFISSMNEEINKGTTPERKNFLQSEIEKANAQVTATQAAITKTQEKIDGSARDRRLALITDENERNLLLGKEAVIKEMEEKLRIYGLTEEERIQIRNEALGKIENLEEEHRKKSEKIEKGFTKGLEDAANEALKTIISVFAEPIDVKSLVEANEKVKGQLDELKSEEEKLFDRLKNNEISFEEYQKGIDDISKKREELKSEMNEMTFGDILLENSIKSLDGIQKAMLNMYNTLLSDQANYIDRKIELDRQLSKRTDTESAEYKKILKEKNQAEEDAAKTTDQMFAIMAVQVAANLGKMVADGKPFLQALVVAVLDAAEAMVPAFVFMITGISLSSPESVLSGGILGIAKAAIVTGLLYAALATLRASAAKSYGFKDGGEIGLDAGVKVGGRQFVMVNETGESEFVVNAKSYRKNKALLQHLNSGGTFESYMASRALSGVYVTPEGTLTTGNSLSHKVYEIQQTLPRLQNQTTVAINTLFEIQRRSDKELITVMKGIRKDIRSLADSYESHSYGHLDVTLDKGVIIKKMESDIQLQRVR